MRRAAAARPRAAPRTRLRKLLHHPTAAHTLPSPQSASETSWRPKASRRQRCSARSTTWQQMGGSSPRQALGEGGGGQAMHTNTMHVTWPRVESRMRLAPRMRMHACMQRAKEQAAHCGGSGPHACMQAGRHGCHARAQLAAAGAGPRVQMLPLTCRRAFNPVPPGIRQDQDLPAAPGRTGGALKGGEAAGCRSCDLTQL